MVIIKTVIVIKNFTFRHIVTTLIPVNIMKAFLPFLILGSNCQPSYSVNFLFGDSFFHNYAGFFLDNFLLQVDFHSEAKLEQNETKK